MSAQHNANRGAKRTPAPLDRDALNALALSYVGKYATTRHKLSAYLTRKVRERGWPEQGPPPIAEIVEKLAQLNFVDDASYARIKAESMTRRGYGPRRLDLALRVAGIDEEDGREARTYSENAEAEAATAFARRRRIGPYSRQADDAQNPQKALAAMLRAGHRYEIAVAILSKNNEFIQDEAFPSL